MGAGGGSFWDHVGQVQVGSSRFLAELFTFSDPFTPKLPLPFQPPPLLASFLLISLKVPAKTSISHSGNHHLLATSKPLFLPFSHLAMPASPILGPI